jgi:hypothetical protein
MPAHFRNPGSRRDREQQTGDPERAERQQRGEAERHAEDVAHGRAKPEVRRGHRRDGRVGAGRERSHQREHDERPELDRFHVAIDLARHCTVTV